MFLIWCLGGTTFKNWDTILVLKKKKNCDEITANIYIHQTISVTLSHITSQVNNLNTA